MGFTALGDQKVVDLLRFGCMGKTEIPLFVDHDLPTLALVADLGGMSDAVASCRKG